MKERGQRQLIGSNTLLAFLMYRIVPRLVCGCFPCLSFTSGCYTRRRRKGTKARPSPVLMDGILDHTHKPQGGKGRGGGGYPPSSHPSTYLFLGEEEREKPGEGRDDDEEEEEERI